MTSTMPIRRWAARGGAAAFTVVALVTGMQVAVTGAAQASAKPSPGTQHVTGHLYPVAGHHAYAAACAKPRAGHAACLALVRTNVTARPRNAHPDAIPGGVGYGPAQLQSAYKLPSSTAGAGQTVAVVDAFNDPNAASDLAAYRLAAGLPGVWSWMFLGGEPERRDQPAARQTRVPAGGTWRSRWTLTWCRRPARYVTSSWSRPAARARQTSVPRSTARWPWVPSSCPTARAARKQRPTQPWTLSSTTTRASR